MTTENPELSRLQDQHSLRTQEVADYQFNIDNFEVAIQVIDDMPEEERAHHAEYRNELVQRLAAEKFQQGRAKVILQALTLRLGKAQA